MLKKLKVLCISLFLDNFLENASEKGRKTKATDKSIEKGTNEKKVFILPSMKRLSDGYVRSFCAPIKTLPAMFQVVNAHW